MARKRLIYCLILIILCTLLLPAASFAEEADRFILNPNQSSLHVDDTLILTIEGQNLTDLYASEIHLTFDSGILQYEGVAKGAPTAELTQGNTIRLAKTLTGAVAGITGNAELYQLKFKAIAAGTASVKLTSVEMVKSADIGQLKSQPGNFGGQSAACAVTVTAAAQSPDDGTPTPTPTPTSTPTPTPTSTQTPTPTSAPRPSTPTVKVEAPVDADGVASATVNAEELQAAIDSAKGQSVNIVIKPADGAREVKVQIPIKQIQSAQAKRIKTIAVDTGLAIVSISPDLLKKNDGAASGNLELSVAKVEVSALPAEIQTKLGGSQAVYDFNLNVDGQKISDFDGNDVKVEVPYTLKSEENPNKVVIYYISDDGRLEVVKNGRYNSTTGKVEFKPKHFSKYSAAYANVAFTDLAGADWALAAIEGLAAREAINGVGHASFHPEGDVTRAEFIAMLMRTFDLADAKAVATFGDVERNAWYYSAVASAQQLGIVNGKDDGSFGVYDKISRQDMAVMIYRAAKALNAELVQSAETVPFADRAEISDYASEAVTAIRQSGIINGMSESIFAPKASSTRAQAAAVIYRLYLAVE